MEASGDFRSAGRRPVAIENAAMVCPEGKLPFPRKNEPWLSNQVSEKLPCGGMPGRTNTLGGVLQDGRQDLGIADGLAREQRRSLHLRVFPYQPDAVKRERSRDCADDRGVAGKYVVQSMKC